MVRASLALALALSVAAAPLSVGAEEAADPLVEARDLYERGTAKFETADYAGAIALWTDAYARVPATAELSEVKTLILYNLATARERAYEVDGDLGQLRKALILLDGFLESVDTIYADPEVAAKERAEAESRRAAIEARITAAEEAEAAGEVVEPAEKPSAEAIVVAPWPTLPDAGPPPGRGLVLGGAALLGLGGASLGLMTTGVILGVRANDIDALDPENFADRREQFERGRLGNTLAIAGGAAAGVTLIGGAVLLALGLKKQRAAAKEQSSAIVAPLLGPGLAGLRIGGRF
jgi:tetratricopeptide (TPR) repeat protein